MSAVFRKTESWKGALAVLLCLALTGAARAQQARVAIQDGPYYVGDSFIVQVTAEGFEESPQPECVAAAPITPGVGGDVSVQLTGVSPSVSTQVIVRNGQMQRFKRVSFVYNFTVTALNEGLHSIGPFTVTQGALSSTTAPVRFQATSVPLDSDMRISLRLPDAPVFPSQRVPISVEWWYAGDIDNVRNINIYSPLFDAFEFEDPPADRASSRLPVNSTHGRTELAAQVEQRPLDGQDYLVVTAERVLVADRVGVFDFEPVTVNISKVTRWRRDFFGGRQPVASERVRAVGEPARLEVKPLPVDDRPASFAGAVGSGFHVSASADRSVVNVGDPIRLTLDLAGAGNLAGASLPRLDAGGEGLVPDLFGLPDTELTGQLVDGVKRFTVDIRVKDPSVRQIPPIAYSWFDPDKARYQTVYTDPIALQVNAARVVSAADVVSSSPPPGADPDDPNDAATTTGVGPALSTRFDLSGADLAIAQDVGRLLGNDAQRFGGAPVRTIIYGLGLLAVIVAWLLRRMADVDPAIAERRHAIARQANAIRRAESLPAREAAAAIADALRHVTSYVPADRRAELDALLNECDTLSYAPVASGGDGGAEGTLDADLHRRAQELMSGLS
ncbi:MAG: hypothetical protein ACYTGQ_04490 [Planctomycetota bacterium]|jgi:hypothetical protein